MGLRWDVIRIDGWRGREVSVTNSPSFGFWEGWAPDTLYLPMIRQGVNL